MSIESLSENSTSLKYQQTEISVYDPKWKAFNPWESVEPGTKPRSSENSSVARNKTRVLDVAGAELALVGLVVAAAGLIFCIYQDGGKTLS